MSILLVLFLAGMIVVAILGLFLTTPAANLARNLRRLTAVALVVAGMGLVYARQFGLAVPLVMGGVMMWRRDASVVGPRRTDGTRSTVRSRFLQMELDHGSGDVEGEVLSGDFAGRRLTDLDLSSLLALAEEIRSDPESLRLLESYLDRAQPGWRDDVENGDPSRGGATPGAFGIDADEAYKILGIQPGASDAEVREAHRRLMKQVHPDRGGTAALAAKINEAKDQLLRRHR